jgi:hypothetical protein
VDKEHGIGSGSSRASVHRFLLIAALHGWRLGAGYPRRKASRSALNCSLWVVGKA